MNSVKYGHWFHRKLQLWSPTLHRINKLALSSTVNLPKVWHNSKIGVRYSMSKRATLIVYMTKEGIYFTKGVIYTGIGNNIATLFRRTDNAFPRGSLLPSKSSLKELTGIKKHQCFNAGQFRIIYIDIF